jgi:hypothetical protein
MAEQSFILLPKMFGQYQERIMIPDDDSSMKIIHPLSYID